MITIGDTGCIKNMEQLKADALDIMDKWHDTFQSPYTDEVYDYFKPDRVREAVDSSFTYTVEGIVNQDGTLYAICHAHGVQIVYVTALDNLSCYPPHQPFNVGQLVTVTRPLYCYSAWSELIDSLDGQIENYQDVRSRWVKGQVLGAGGVYKVVYVGRNIARPEEGYIAIIDNGTQVCIMSTDGIVRTYAWEEYRQYLRNWAAKYTEYSPSHSPKTYEQWVQARNGNE